MMPGRVFRRTSSLLLRSPDGSPVWPVRSTEEADALRCAAEAFSVQLDELRAQATFAEESRHAGPVERAPAPAPDGVLGVGEAVRADTQLYAHLTGRRAAYVENWVPGASERMRPPAVVVARANSVTSSLLESLYAWSHSGRTAGLVTGSSASALRQNVLCSALLAGPSGISPLRVELNPASPMGAIRKGHLLRLGGQAAPAEVEKALSAGAAILAIHAHSDGFDASLPNTILCTVKSSRPAPAVAWLGPRCAETGLCHRLGAPVERAVENKALMSPDTLSALLAVFASCSMLVQADHPVVHPAWSLAFRLAENPRIGAALVPTETMMASPSTLEPLVDALSNGVDVGTALADFHRSHCARRLGNRFILLGDPRTSMAQGRRVSRHGTGERLRRRAPPPIVSRNDAECAAMLRNGIASSRAQWKDSERPAALRALEELEQYEALSWSWGSVVEQRGIERSMQDAVIAYVEVRGWAKIISEWMRICPAKEKLHGTQRCGFCSGQVVSFSCSPRGGQSCARRFTECSCCGALESTPLENPIRVVRENDRSYLQGALPQRRWRGRLITWSQWRRESRGKDWPALPCGRPEDRFPEPITGPIGPLRQGAVLMLRSAPILVVKHARCSAGGVAGETSE